MPIPRRTQTASTPRLSSALLAQSPASNGFWVTPVSVAVVWATALHLQLPELPDSRWTLGVALCGLGAALLGWAFMRAPAQLMDWQHPGTWRWSLAKSLVWAALVHPALGLGAMTWAWANHRAQQQLEQSLPPEWEGRRVVVQAQVESLPQRTEYGWRFKARVDEVVPLGSPLTRPQPVPLPLPLRMSLSVTDASPAAQSDWAEGDRPVPAPPRVGEVWRWAVRLKAPHGLRNPHGDDAELRAWAQGVSVWATQTQRRDAPPAQRLLSAQEAKFRPNLDAGVGMLHRVQADFFLRIEQAREWVRDRLWTVQAQLTDSSTPPLDPRDVGVVMALLIGDQSAIAPPDWRLFRDTGIAHLMSISGLHITAWSLLCAALVRRIWRLADGWGWAWSLWWPAPLAAAWLGLWASLAYALFSGWGLPAQRTVGMLALMVLLRTRGHQWPWLSQWLTIAALITLWQPTSLVSPGFWLSFLAVGVLLAEGGERRSARDTQMASQSPAKTWLWKNAFLAIKTQWRINVLMWPLTWVLFGQVSWVSALVNLVAIPWVSWVVLPLAVTALASEWALSLAVQSVHLMRLALQFAGQSSWAVAWWPAAPWWQMGLAVCGAMVCVWSRWPWRWRSLGVVLMGWPLWSAPGSQMAGVPAWAEVSVWALDVGQGQAVVLRTQNQTWLYDAGPGQATGWNAGEQVVLPFLRAQGWPLHGLILSHADADHTGGAEAVLKAHPELRWMGALPKAHRLHALRPGIACQKGLRWWVDGVRFEVLHPFEIDDARSSNRQSCVVRVQAASGAVLLLGDLEAADEQNLVNAGAALRAHVLMVAHHGSRSSSSEALLQAVQPHWAWIQAGYLNPHGHPHESVVHRLQQAGARVVSTPICGAIHWQSAAPEQLHCERQVDAHFWSHRTQLRAHDETP